MTSISGSTTCSSIALEPLHSDVTVIYVLGGPGAGKGTLCAEVTREFQIKHLSVGDVLRNERDTPGSKYGELIARNMEEGRIGPMEVTVHLLNGAINAARQNDDINVFLIDGFPRKMDQLQLFESTLSRVALALFLDSSEDIRRERLYKRAKLESRLDDTVDIIQKRFQTFNDTCMAVINYLEGEGRVEAIVADGDINSVYSDVIHALQNFLQDDLKRR